MEGPRLRILQLLQKNTNDTVGGLAQAIGLAVATIRRHLDILRRDPLVAFEEVRKKTGRPEYSFFLTEDGQEAGAFAARGPDSPRGPHLPEIFAANPQQRDSPWRPWFRPEGYTGHSSSR